MSSRDVISAAIIPDAEHWIRRHMVPSFVPADSLPSWDEYLIPVQTFQTSSWIVPAWRSPCLCHRRIAQVCRTTLTYHQVSPGVFGVELHRLVHQHAALHAGLLPATRRIDRNAASQHHALQQYHLAVARVRDCLLYLRIFCAIQHFIHL